MGLSNEVALDLRTKSPAIEEEEKNSFFLSGAGVQQAPPGHGHRLGQSHNLQEGRSHIG